MKRYVYPLLILLCLAAAARAGAEEAQFLQPRDADSFLVEMRGLRTQVRLIGVDAPEHGQEWGEKASEFTRRFCLQGPLELEYDLDHYDRYNRLLCYVWANGRMLNLEPVRAGLALPAYYRPNGKHRAQFEQAAADAKLARSGFWAQGGLRLTPKAFRQAKK